MCEYINTKLTAALTPTTPLNVSHCNVLKRANLIAIIIMCKQARLAASEIDKLGPLPDPTPGNDSHYKSFDEVFKNHNIRTPPLIQEGPRQNYTPFRSSVQHIYATQTIIMLQCDECSL